MRIKSLFVVLAVGGSMAAVAVGSASAQTSAPLARPLQRAPASLVPSTGFFVGLGGSLNAVDFGTRDVYFKGTADVYLNGVYSSSGSADGTGFIDTNNEVGAGFSAPGGYFQRIPDSNWLWGAKFSYSYLGGIDSKVRNALVPQAGSFTPVGSTVPVPFTGHVAIRSYELQMIHKLAFVPFIGRSFERSFVYVGAGPTLSQVQTDLVETIGFAFGDGRPTDISGLPASYSSKSWVYGGMVIVGFSYFLSPTWFLDLSYSFAMTANKTDDYWSLFVNNRGVNGSTGNGTLVGSSSGTTITQGVMLTVNKVF